MERLPRPSGPCHEESMTPPQLTGMNAAATIAHKPAFNSFCRNCHPDESPRKELAPNTSRPRAPTEDVPGTQAPPDLNLKRAMPIQRLRPNGPPTTTRNQRWHPGEPGCPAHERWMRSFLRRPWQAVGDLVTELGLQPDPSRGVLRKQIEYRQLCLLVRCLTTPPLFSF